MCGRCGQDPIINSFDPAVPLPSGALITSRLGRQAGRRFPAAGYMGLVLHLVQAEKRSFLLKEQLQSGVKLYIIVGQDYAQVKGLLGAPIMNLVSQVI